MAGFKGRSSEIRCAAKRVPLHMRGNAASAKVRIRMAAMRKLRRSVKAIGERQVRAVHVERPKDLDFNGLGNSQGIFQFNAEISRCAVHLCMI
jgi:hypothetical protein